MSAPIGHTCPDIDTAKKRLADLVGYAADELTPQTLRHINREADCLGDDLENLRTSNETLRSWGEGLEAERDELQGQLDDANEEQESLQEKLDAATEDAAQLGAVCEELVAVLGRRAMTRRQRLAAMNRILSEAGFKAALSPQEEHTTAGDAGQGVKGHE